MKYANIVIDNKSNSTDNFYTYGYDLENIAVGSKVFVPFAKSKKPREGYVVSKVADRCEIDSSILSKIREIEGVDPEISLTPEMMRTAVWMKGRYLCRYIDAIKCFTPAGSSAKRREKKNSLKGVTGTRREISKLTGEQEEAIARISEAVEGEYHDRFLLHGVTGSGKTEVYLRVAQKVLDQGKSVIVLVPEISLTGQTVDRFLGYFGENSVAVLHSKLSSGERYDQWKNIKDGKVKIVIGARSAVFAPLEKIGLIVLDEEHEATYKSDFTPKYDTVEVAIKRLKDEDNRGVLLLGSATPSVVTYSRALEGIYKLIKLTRRYNESTLPEGEIVDMCQEMKNGNRSPVSQRLEEEMRKCLQKGQQVMLFLNRRGYSTFVSCRECGYVVKCPVCGLSLTYHRDGGQMTCHYCGYNQAAPVACPECGSPHIKYFGSGTEKIQEKITELFSEYEIDRIDLDSVKTQGELKRKLKAFEKGKTRILIGTQLIAKGLDFRNVGLVGVISADVSLNIPDFRSPERAFQLITQAGGRAGRGDESGKVIIQTYSPDHYAIVKASTHDYEGFFKEEEVFRRLMKYPPYSDIIRVLFTADSAEEARRGAENWHRRLCQMMTKEERHNVFSPQEAYMSKIRDTYRYSLVIKAPKGQRGKYASYLNVIREEEKTSASKKKQGYIAVADINPYSFS